MGCLATVASCIYSGRLVGWRLLYRLGASLRSFGLICTGLQLELLQRSYIISLSFFDAALGVDMMIDV